MRFNSSKIHWSENSVLVIVQMNWIVIHFANINWNVWFPNSERVYNSHRTTTVAIGTSLVNGLGPRLNKLGVSATTYMYRGATVPDLQSHIKYIMNSHEKPDRIVLQCGGNDAERQPTEVVTTRIETLVHTIKRLCPTSGIIINKIPPRGTDNKILSKIEVINSSLDNHYCNDVLVEIINACSTSLRFYRSDFVHFNPKGAYQFAKQLADTISNFTWRERRKWI